MPEAYAGDAPFLIIPQSEEQCGAHEIEIVRLINNTCAPDTDLVAEEIPVALVYNGISHAVMMTTPNMLEEFALGFTLAEGIASTPSEIYSIEVTDGCRGGKNVEL